MSAATPLVSSGGEFQQVFLVPGSMYCSPMPSIVSTVLGSCVSVCLWDFAGRGGGMNHFVLPHAPAGEESLRYGDVAMRVLWRSMERLGTTRRVVRAKIFGGAAVLPFGDDETVGEKNVRLARGWLDSLGIPLMAAQTGGGTGLHVRFNTGDGTVATRGITPRPR
jgi:chemotaxis protein CheD